MFKLKSLKIPDGVTTIDYGLFFGCKDLESVNIPETVTSVKDSAFYGCNSLTDIEIPERVTSIGDSAFSYCNSLSSITILNPQCEIEDNLYVIPDNTTIRGYGGSTAESYAQKYGKYFETIDDQPIVTTPAVTTDVSTTAVTTPASSSQNVVTSMSAVAVTRESVMTTLYGVPDYSHTNEYGVPASSISVATYITYYTEISYVPVAVKTTACTTTAEPGLTTSVYYPIYTEKNTTTTPVSSSQNVVTSISYVVLTSVSYVNVTEPYPGTDYWGNVITSFVEVSSATNITLISQVVVNVTTTTEVTTTPMIDYPHIRGDANSDGQLNIRDAAFIAIMIEQHRLDELPEWDDYNLDGIVNITDAAVIARDCVRFKKNLTLLPSSNPKGEQLSLSSAEGKPGEVVNLNINVECDNQFESADFSLCWTDKNLIVAEAYGEQAFAASESGEGYVNIAAFGFNAINDGDIAAVKFTIPEDAKPGTVYNIYFSDINTFAVLDGSDIADSVAVSGGTITVLDEPEATTPAVTEVTTTSYTTVTTTSNAVSTKVSIVTTAESVIITDAENEGYITTIHNLRASK